MSVLSNKKFWQEFANTGNQMKIRTRKLASVTSLIVASVTASLILAATSANAGVIVAENFGGTGAALNGTTADTFNAAVTAAGGSATWGAGAAFLDNGTVTVDTLQNSAYLNLGSYINNAKGTASGMFDLTMTISPTVGNWISLGFATNTTPITTKNFTDTGVGVANSTVGIATILYRAVSAPGELDMFGGLKSGSAVDGPDGNTGNRTVTVTLDLTPAFYNGSTTFGKVTWSDSVLGMLTNHTYTTEPSFGSILISDSASSAGTVSALTLTQILPPALQIAPNNGNLRFEWGSLAGKQYDLVATNNLAAPIATWPPYNDGVTTYTNIPAAGTSLNVLTNVVKVGPTKFFILIEKP